MRLEAFITDLLYDHDCVVIPGFGGLVANYRPARLNRRSHVIMPPSKHVGFNRNLRNNDGLLTNHVAGTLGISYKEATQRIDETVQGYLDHLQAEGRLMWEKIGVFFKDKSGQLQFIPEEQENFLLSSFGLTPVQLKPVIQVEQMNETPIIPINSERRKFAAWKVAAAIAVPLLLAGSLLVRNGIKNDPGFSLASLNPFQENEIVATYQQITDPKQPLEKNIQAGELQQAVADSTITSFRYDFLNDRIVDAGILVKKDKPTKKSIVAVKHNAPEHSAASVHGRYAVIGGAFQVDDNAQKFLEKLKADGFDAQLAGRKDGLQLVAYGLYDSKEEAGNALRNIRASNAHAWLKRN